MHWEEAFKLSLINHRAPFLGFITWALDVEVKRIAEIGVNKGETAQLLRHLFPNAELFLIDPWQLSRDYFYSATPISRKEKHYKKAFDAVSSYFAEDPKTTILRMTAVAAVQETPDDFDLVFIDANHEYTQVRDNILAWLPKVRPGGILSGHDYTDEIPMFSGVKRAVDELFGKEILLGHDRVWIYQKDPLNIPLPPQSYPRKPNEKFSKYRSALNE